MKYSLILLTVLMSCVSKDNKNSVNSEELLQDTLEVDKEEKIDSLGYYDTDEKIVSFIYYSADERARFHDSTFVALKKIDSTFYYDLRYATDNNFLKEKVYDCADCFVRYKTAKKLIIANDSFKKIGFRIKFFDCYRPLAIQKKMWEIYPDKRYVANPAKGSNHNRGSAIDITLVNNLGSELAMGTEFDFFGRKAHHAYQNLPKQVLENRKLLKSVMEANGFWSITSEWWHYNLEKSYQYKVSDFKTECDDQ